MKEGIYKMLNNAYEKVNAENFIITESWRKQKARLQLQDPRAKIKYSYKTKQFTILYDLPADYYKLKDIKVVL